MTNCVPSHSSHQQGILANLNPINALCACDLACFLILQPRKHKPFLLLVVFINNLFRISKFYALLLKPFKHLSFDVFGFLFTKSTIKTLKTPLEAITIGKALVILAEAGLRVLGGDRAFAFITKISELLESEISKLKGSDLHDDLVQE